MQVARRWGDGRAQGGEIAFNLAPAVAQQWDPKLPRRVRGPNKASRWSQARSFFLLRPAPEKRMKKVGIALRCPRPTVYNSIWFEQTNWRCGLAIEEFSGNWTIYFELHQRVKMLIRCWWTHQGKDPTHFLKPWKPYRSTNFVFSSSLAPLHKIFRVIMNNETCYHLTEKFGVVRL